MPHLNLKTALIALAIVVVTLKFRNQLLGVFARIPVVGGLVA
jgi:hypothetical protein